MKDSFQTPIASLDPILSLLPAGSFVLEPCAGRGNIVRCLLSHGHEVLAIEKYPVSVSGAGAGADADANANSIAGADANANSIADANSPVGIQIFNADFLKIKITNPFEFIVTNPPYSLIEEFIVKCLSYNKPTALLLPITALGGKARQRIYRQAPPSLIFVGGRINFETPNNAYSNAQFETAWFLWNFDVPPIQFTTLRAYR